MDLKEAGDFSIIFYCFAGVAVIGLSITLELGSSLSCEAVSLKNVRDLLYSKIPLYFLNFLFPLGTSFLQTMMAAISFNHR